MKFNFFEKKKQEVKEVKPIYKPISTIKGMVEERAKSFAESDSLEKPTEEHYNMAFNYYKFLKGMMPDAYKGTIRANSNDKEMRDEMGKDLYETYNEVWGEVYKESDNNIVDDEEKEIKAKNLSYKKEEEEILNFKKIFLKIKLGEFKNNPRIVSAFKDKPYLLKKYTDSYLSTAIQLIEAYKNSY